MKKTIRALLVGVQTFIILMSISMIADRLNFEINNIIRILLSVCSAVLASYIANKVVNVNE